MTASSEQDAELAKLRAEIAKTEAEAEKLRVDTETARWKALVPDLGSVKGGTLSAPPDKAVSAVLAYRALELAAREVAAALEGKLAKRVLITSTVDLASSAAAYLDVNEALNKLIQRVDTVLGLDPSKKKGGARLAGTVTAIAAAIGALPGFLSLLNVSHSISVAGFAPDDTAAGALLAGALLDRTNGPEVVHDGFRLPPKGRIWTKMSDLADRRAKVVTALMEATPPQGAEEPSRAMTLWLNELKAALAAIDALDARLRSKPEGEARSSLIQASLYEELFLPAQAASGIPHVLLVKSEGGQVSQAISDQVIGTDKITLIAEAAITYMLLDTATQKLVAAGTRSGIAQAMGVIGSPLTFIPEK